MSDYVANGCYGKYIHLDLDVPDVALVWQVKDNYPAGGSSGGYAAVRAENILLRLLELCCMGLALMFGRLFY